MLGLRQVSRSVSLILRHASTATLAPRAVLTQPGPAGAVMPAAGLALSRQFSVSPAHGASSYNSTLDTSMARQTPPTNYGIRYRATLRRRGKSLSIVPAWARWVRGSIHN